MTVEILTKEDLKKFKAELFEEIKQILSPATSQNKQWIKSPEVRKILGISPGTLQNLRINGTLPFTKIGGIIYYKYEDVMLVLEANMRK